MTDDASLTMLQSRVAAWGRMAERIAAEIADTRAAVTEEGEAQRKRRRLVLPPSITNSR